MYLIFVGYVVSEGEAGSLKGTSVAGNKMALNILERLNAYQDCQMHIVTLYPIPAYPKNKKIVFSSRIIPISNRLKTFCVGFLNFPAIKQLCQIITLYRHLKQLVKSHPDVVFLTYNFYPQIGIPLGWLKRQYPCTVATLLADPPIDVIPRKGLSRFLRRVYYWKSKRCLRNVDQLIVVNEHAAQLFAPGLEHIVVEGGVVPQEVGVGNNGKPQGEKVVLYSGALIDYNGIRELIEAMGKVRNQQVILHIYGSGPLENYVKKCASETNRIIYCGNVENRVVLQKQREAFLLVNPRKVDEPVSRFTFPSKMFEYMLSGTPVLTTRLNCFTSDYFDKMFFSEDNNPVNLAREIDQIAAMDQAELIQIAAKARDFVLHEKSWDQQVDRIYRFIRGDRKGDSIFES